MQKVGSKVLSVSVGNLSSDEEFLTPISFIFELVRMSLTTTNVLAFLFLILINIQAF